MDIKFADFCFDPEKLTLYRQGEQLALKRNQALLLRFFLSRAGEIHSKDAILDEVWRGKVVSEQVVFQTISQLRGIFGNQAIKTYSKQGYRWQLAIEQATVEPNSDVDTDGTNIRAARKKYGLAVLLMVCVAVFGLRAYNQDESQVIYYHALGEGQVFQRALKRDNQFKLGARISDVSVSQAFNTPELIWTQQNLAKDQWLFLANTYKDDQGLFLHYGLARGKVSWQGYVFAQDQQRLSVALADRLQQLRSMGLFSASLQQLGLVELSAMFKLQPDNPELLLRLGKEYINMQQQDVALIYLQRVLAMDNSYASSAERANAHWAIGKIYKMRGQHFQADNSLQKMSDILEPTPLWPLRLHQIKTRAWLAYDKTESELMYQTLEHGLKMAKEQADPLISFKLHILYSTLAQRVGDEVKKYQHLNRAQALLLEHKLDQSNRALVLYHFALYTQDNHQALPYLQRILTLPRSEENYWIQDQTFELLVEHYLDSGELTKAAELFDRQENNPGRLLLKARLLLLQQQESSAFSVLEQSFELARLHYNNRAALRAALMLYELSVDQPQQKAQYLAYMQANAGQEWLAQHKLEVAHN